MTDNLTIWNKLGTTDPSHTKQFKRAGGFQGTALKPMWCYQKMTELFGPCGQGWGMSAPQHQIVNGADDEVLVYCTCEVWYMQGEKRHSVFGTGGDKIVSKTKYGMANDDEAFKKAYTDAIMNGLKMIGVGADVHLGMFDDCKYVNSVRAEFADNQPDTKADKPQAAQAAKPASKADSRDTFARLQEAIRGKSTLEALNAMCNHAKTKEAIATMPQDWQNQIEQQIMHRLRELS